MPRYWDLLGEYDAETETYSEFAGAHGANPYSPITDGRLVGLRCVPGREAATSLINAFAFKLTCPTFAPSTQCIVGGAGSGLQTAPALQAGHVDWEVDLPVRTGQNIKLEGKCMTSDTPVTMSAFLWGLFETSR